MVGFRISIAVLFLLIIVQGKGQDRNDQPNDMGQGTFKVVGHKPNNDPDNHLNGFVVVESIQLDYNYITRNRIILREILFKVGDTISSDHFLDLAEQSRQNLLNTSLFNFVELVVDMGKEPYAHVRVKFVERWYLWPFPILELGERNMNMWLDNPRFSRLNYGLNLTRVNFRGRKETLALLLRLGYRQNYSVSYNKPYFNAAQTLGLGLSGGVNLRREMAYNSHDNKQVFYSKPTGVVYQQYYIDASLTYRPAIHNSHTLILGFKQHHFADSLLILNPNFSPGNQTVVPYFSATYLFKNDFRDLRAYPLNGHYFDFRLSRQGFGILPNEIMDVFAFETSVRKFWELSPRWFTAGGVNAKASTGDYISYFNQQGLGFKGDIVRGFEDYVVDGQHFFVLKSNLKYALIPQRSSNIAFIPDPKFSLVHYAIYLNVFADAGIVSDRLFAETNPLANRWLGGTGMGLDFVTYYDKVFRVELSLNSIGEAGFFFHMLAPI